MTTVDTSVYIHGYGCIAAPGYGPPHLIDALATSKPGPCGDHESLEQEHESSVAAITNFDPTTYLKLRGMRPLCRASQLACVAAAAALNYPEQLGDSEASAVVVGTQYGSIEPLVEFNRSALVDGVHLVNPAHFPNVVVNAHAGYLGLLFGLAGPNITLCGRSAGLEAIAQAADLLLLDRAEYVLAGGIEALGTTLLKGYARVDQDNDAALPGEGAAFLLLSRSETPSMLGRILGYGTSTVHLSSDVEESRERAIFDALRSSGVSHTEINSIWHCGDSQATNLLEVVFPHASIRMIHHVTGDCRAANGALAAVAATHALTDTSHMALITDFPPTGTQVAIVIAPV